MSIESFSIIALAICILVNFIILSTLIKRMRSLSLRVSKIDGIRSDMGVIYGEDVNKFTVKTMSGSKVELGLNEKEMVLIFISDSCQMCINNFLKYMDIVESKKGAGIDALIIISSQRDKLENISVDRVMQDVVISGDDAKTLMHKFGIKVLPSMITIDEKMHISYVGSPK